MGAGPSARAEPSVRAEGAETATAETTTAETTTPESATAETVWRLMVQAALDQFGRTSAMLAELGLTPGHLKALLLLDPADAQPMGALAAQFACDASTMTWLVDRLEERGLVQRQAHPGDRRVKAVALTAQGVRTKAELERRLYQPPDPITALDPDTLAVLAAALRQVHDLC